MKLIVGLGNIGKQYEGNRHNIGFYMIEKFCANHKQTKRIHQPKYQCLLNTLYLSQKIICIKPTTLMNLSGIAVQAVYNYYNITKKNLIILHDDIDLAVGQVKYKDHGSLAGHNGLKSIANKLGTTDFQRIRIGVGRPPATYDISSYVLSNITSSEQQLIDDQYPIIQKHLEKFCTNK